MTATITIELSITREAEVEMTTRKRKRKKTNIDVLGRWRLDRQYCLCWKSGVGYPILRGSREKNQNGNSEREREWRRKETAIYEIALLWRKVLCRRSPVL